MNGDILDRINELKHKKNLEIISYCTVHQDVQKISDFSAGFRKLYEHCKKSDKRIFFYCGPDFAVNLLYALLPTKIFFKIRESSECNLNDFMWNIEIKELMQMFPLAKVAVYYKSNVKILATADIIIDDTDICGAFKRIEAKQIIFTPDYNVGYYAKSLNPEKEIIVPHGFCPSLYGVTADAINAAKIKHPDSKIIIHPEANYHTHKLADYMFGYDDAFDFFSRTERGAFILVYSHYFISRLRADFPHLQIFKPDNNLKCVGVKDITVEMIPDALDKLQFNIEIPEEYRIVIEKKLKKFLDLK